LSDEWFLLIRFRRVFSDRAGGAGDLPREAAAVGGRASFFSDHGNAWYLLVATPSVIDYVCALRISQAAEEGRRKFCLAFCVVSNLALLAISNTQTFSHDLWQAGGQGHTGAPYFAACGDFVLHVQDHARVFKEAAGSGPAGAVRRRNFRLSLAVCSTATALSAVTAYSLQIYCDFSGYPDIAIGISKIIGFDLPENFNMP
jgi:hypothetical protein